MLHLSGQNQRRRITLLVVGLAALFVATLACNAPGDENRTLAPTVSSAPVAEPTKEAPTAPPEPTAVPAPDAAHEGISFSYDASLAADVSAATIPASDVSDGPEWEVAPQHVVFSFVDCVLPDTYHKPAIIVYPANEFATMSEIAAGTIADLRTLLQQKPTSPEHIPFLPMWNAAQFLQANVAYIGFQNGTGVRFLTQYGQAANPVNNHELFYTFQGLSHDGRFYVVAILPTSNPVLPIDGSAIPGDDYNAFADNFPNYLDDIEQQLGALPAASFIPDLSLLDGMIQSLRAE